MREIDEKVLRRIWDGHDLSMAARPAELTAEGSSVSFRAGEELVLEYRNGIYRLFDGSGNDLHAHIYVNVPVEEAKLLGSVGATFTVVRGSRGLIRAEICSPYVSVHRGAGEWNCLA